jgi:hypothetical protein
LSSKLTREPGRLVHHILMQLPRYFERNAIAPNKVAACWPLHTVKEEFQADPLSSKLSPSMGSTMTVS